MRLISSGISRTITAVVVLIILVVAGVSAYYLATSSSPAKTTTTTTPTTSTTSTTSTTTTSSSISIVGHTFAEDNIFGEPNSVDVDSLNSWTGQGMSQQLFQTLVWYQGSTTVPEGVLASSWSVSTDGMTYTFNLKHGIVFSDGKQFSAYDVWFNMYRYVVDQGPYSYILGPVLTNLPGGANVTKGYLNTFNFTSPTSSQITTMENPSQSVQVVDQYTVAFHLSAPSGAFVEKIGSAAAAIEEPDWIQTHGGGVLGPGQTNTVVAHNPPPGTGPYILQQWVTGCCITLTPNPHYAGPTPFFTKVVVNYKNNFLDAVNDLKTKAINGLWAAPFKQADQVIGVSGITVQTTGISWFTQALALNTQSYPLNITNVRLAITYGTNRSALMQAAIGPHGSLFQGPTPLGMVGSNSSIQPLPYDTAKAKQLLTQAGFPNGAGLRPLVFMYGSAADQAAAAQVFKAEMSQIGITVTLDQVANSVVNGCVTTLPRCPNYPDIAFHPWSPDYAFPDDYAWTFENAASSNNGPNYNDTTLNQLSNQLLTTSDLTQVAHICTQIALRDQALGGWIWLWQAGAPGPGIVAWDSNLVGVTSHINPLSVDFNYSSMSSA